MSESAEYISPNNYTENCANCRDNRGHEVMKGVVKVQCAARDILAKSTEGREDVALFRESVATAIAGVGRVPSCTPMRNIRFVVENHDNPLREAEDMLRVVGITPEAEYGPKFLQILDVLLAAFPHILQAEVSLQIVIERGLPLETLCSEGSPLDYLGTVFCNETYVLLDAIFTSSDLALSEDNRAAIRTKLDQLRVMVGQIEGLRRESEARLRSGRGSAWAQDEDGDPEFVPDKSAYAN